jgi:hypothetical protein
MSDFTDRGKLLPAPFETVQRGEVPDIEEQMDLKTAIDLAVIALGDKFDEAAKSGDYTLAGGCHTATMRLECERLKIERAEMGAD